ncbi:pra1 family protein [Plakobranchus ocellatus]|uniref:PRA1 family protein n=1 Tax=Plakobranchus ocellatus TaxID=259542 RepID=A0AAV3YQR1_9GAST|nr:pra1 family protein [Plakobranchus ocellatus]
MRKKCGNSAEKEKKIRPQICQCGRIKARWQKKIVSAGAPTYDLRLRAVPLLNTTARELFPCTRERVKPWADFINCEKMGLPGSVFILPFRIIGNIDRFLGNYLLVILGSIIYFNPTLLILLVAICACLMAFYLISTKKQERNIPIMGREHNLAKQYAAVGAASFLLYWKVGVGLTNFWVIIGSSFFVIMLHANVYETQEEIEVPLLLLDT